MRNDPAQDQRFTFRVVLNFWSSKCFSFQLWADRLLQQTRISIRILIHFFQEAAREHWEAAGWVAFRNCKCSAGDPLVAWKTEIWMKRLNYFTKTHRLNHHNLNDYFKLEIHLRPPLGSYRERVRKQMLATLGSSISRFFKNGNSSLPPEQKSDQ